MRKLFNLLISFPKTVYFNMKVFPLRKAIYLPILIHYKVKLDKCSRGCIKINSQLRPLMIKYGWGEGSFGVFNGNKPQYGGGYLRIANNSKLVFLGKANFSSGISIRIEDGGCIEFGENFSCSVNCFFAANKLIKFGENNLIGWNVNIRDVDGHNIFSCRDLNNDYVLNEPREIVIGDKVWIAAHVHILKGVKVPNNTIIAYKTLLTKSFNEANCIIGGNPNRILKQEVKWCN